MKGILFKPDMIQAIIEGRKTQIRRVIKPQPKRINSDFDGTWEWKEKGHYYDDLTLFSMLKNSSRYRVGETVYIKEAWYHTTNPIPTVWYKADHPNLVKVKWKSPLSMPEWAARHFITITEVRAERLQEITWEAIEAEGVTIQHKHAIDFDSGMRMPEGNYHQWLRVGFEELWNPINPKYPWQSNPWVFAYTFRRA